MNRQLLFLSVFGMLGLPFCAAGQTSRHEKGKDINFSKQVDDVLAGPWTRLRITVAVITDYGSTYASAVEAVREKRSGTIEYRILRKKSEDYKPMSEVQFNRFTEEIRRAATEVENEWTYPESLREGTPSQVRQMFEQGKLPKVLDVLGLIIRSESPGGSHFIANGGATVSLARFLEHEFGVKQRELEEDELELVLGYDPDP